MARRDSKSAGPLYLPGIEYRNRILAHQIEIDLPLPIGDAGLTGTLNLDLADERSRSHIDYADPANRVAQEKASLGRGIIEASVAIGIHVANDASCCEAKTVP